MARSSGRRHASRLSPLLPSVAQGFRIVGPTCAAARRPADPRRVRREPAPSHHSRLAVAVQLSGGKVRLVGTRVAPDDAGNAPQVEPRRSTQVIATTVGEQGIAPKSTQRVDDESGTARTGPASVGRALLISMLAWLDDRQGEAAPLRHRFRKIRDQAFLAALAPRERPRNHCPDGALSSRRKVVGVRSQE